MHETVLAMTSVPEWRQVLLDKKKRQDENDRKKQEEDLKKLATLPEWKRNLILQRKSQGSNVIFISSGATKKTDKQSPRALDQDTPRTGRNSNNSIYENNLGSERDHVPFKSATPGHQNDNEHNETMKNGYADETERCVSVQNNPWVHSDKVRKKVGRNTERPNSRESQNSEINSNHVSKLEHKTDSDSEEPYRPGFVNRLLGKFASLTGSPGDGKPSRFVRRSSSLERVNGDDIRRRYSRSASSSDYLDNDIGSIGKYAKALSVDNLSNTGIVNQNFVEKKVKVRRSSSFNRSRSDSFDSNHSNECERPRSETFPQDPFNGDSPRNCDRSPRGSYARDDIIIIEKSPNNSVRRSNSFTKTESSVTKSNGSTPRGDSSPRPRLNSGSGESPRMVNSSSNHEGGDVYRIRSGSREMLEEELPKPNTVLSLFSKFEDPSARGYNDTLKKRRAPKPPNPPNNLKLKIETGSPPEVPHSKPALHNEPLSPVSHRTPSSVGPGHGTVGTSPSAYVSSKPPLPTRLTNGNRSPNHKPGKRIAPKPPSPGSPTKPFVPLPASPTKPYVPAPSPDGEEKPVVSDTAQHTSSVVSNTVSQMSSLKSAAQINTVSSDYITPKPQIVSKSHSYVSSAPKYTKPSHENNTNSIGAVPPLFPSLKLKKVSKPSDYEENSSAAEESPRIVSPERERVHQTTRDVPKTDIKSDIDIGTRDFVGNNRFFSASESSEPAVQHLDDGRMRVSQEHLEKIRRAGKSWFFSTSNNSSNIPRACEFVHVRAKPKHKTIKAVAAEEKRAKENKKVVNHFIPDKSIFDTPADLSANTDTTTSQQNYHSNTYIVNKDVPVTNIDDVTPEKKQPVKKSKIEFVNDGVIHEKSILTKQKKPKKVSVAFNENSLAETFEYPSEINMLITLKAAGIETYNDEIREFEMKFPNGYPMDDEEEDKPAVAMTTSSSLISTPAIGSGASSLSNYKGRFQMDYQFGQNFFEEQEQATEKKPEPVQENPEDLQIKPADEEENFMWSDAATSDLLF